MGGDVFAGLIDAIFAVCLGLVPAAELLSDRRAFSLSSEGLGGAAAATSDALALLDPGSLALLNTLLTRSSSSARVGGGVKEELGEG